MFQYEISSSSSSSGILSKLILLLLLGLLMLVLMGVLQLTTVLLVRELRTGRFRDILVLTFSRTVVQLLKKLPDKRRFPLAWLCHDNFLLLLSVCLLRVE